MNLDIPHVPLPRSFTWSAHPWRLAMIATLAAAAPPAKSQP